MNPIGKKEKSQKIGD
jgi:hypothetical protein